MITMNSMVCIKNANGMYFSLKSSGIFIMSTSKNLYCMTCFCNRLCRNVPSDHDPVPLGMYEMKFWVEELGAFIHYPMLTNRTSNTLLSIGFMIKNMSQNIGCLSGELADERVRSTAVDRYFGRFLLFLDDLREFLVERLGEEINDGEGSEEEEEEFEEGEEIDEEVLELE